MNVWPSSFCTFGCLSGFTRMTALVEHTFVALNHDLQITLVLETNPCATVGQCIAAVDARLVEGRAHASAGRSAPRAVELLDVDANVLVPEHEFKHVGSRVIPARYEGR